MSPLLPATFHGTKLPNAWNKKLFAQNGSESRRQTMWRLCNMKIARATQHAPHCHLLARGAAAPLSVLWQCCPTSIDWLPRPPNSPDFIACATKFCSIDSAKGSWRAGKRVTVVGKRVRNVVSRLPLSKRMRNRIPGRKHATHPATTTAICYCDCIASCDSTSTSMHIPSAVKEYPTC